MLNTSLRSDGGGNIRTATCDGCEEFPATIRCRTCKPGFAFLCEQCYRDHHVAGGCGIQHEAVRFDEAGGFLGEVVAHTPIEGWGTRTVLEKCLACDARRTDEPVVWFTAVVYGLTGSAAEHLFGKWACKCGAKNGTSAMHFDCMSGTTASELSDEVFYSVPLLRLLSSLRQATGYAPPSTQNKSRTRRHQKILSANFGSTF